MHKIIRNPIAVALRSGEITRCAIVGARKGKGSYRRQPKHKGRAFA
jgi:stalled ribosome alternative rescue factor ArfA